MLIFPLGWCSSSSSSGSSKYDPVTLALCFRFSCRFSCINPCFHPQRNSSKPQEMSPTAAIYLEVRSAFKLTIKHINLIIIQLSVTFLSLKSKYQSLVSAVESVEQSFFCDIICPIRAVVGGGCRGRSGAWTSWRILFPQICSRDHGDAQYYISLDIP